MQLGTDGIYPRDESKSLPVDLLMHNVTTLKSVHVDSWYPAKDFTLLAGCMMRLAMRIKTSARLDLWQKKGCPLLMLCL